MHAKGGFRLGNGRATMKFKDYYEVMGLERNAPADEIKRTYRRLARKYHPDVSKEADAEVRFKEVGEAYEVLKDPEKRAAYDQLGTRYQAGQEFRPPPDWSFESAAGPRATSFSDFFEQLFGGMAPGMGPGRGPGGGRARVRPGRRGQDTSAQVEIALEEAFAGTQRTLSLQRSEVGADGRPQARTQQLRVKIPAGVTDGQQIRVAGQGAQGFGGANGDLFLRVKIAPHRWFRLEGRDVWLDLPVTPWEAALGGSVRIPTLAGKVDMRIPKGSQSGKELRLKGKGLPGTPPGDQRLVLKIVTPEAHTEEQENLYREMAAAMPMNPRAALEN
jgi:curved DNA-binding protein